MAKSENDKENRNPVVNQNRNKKVNVAAEEKVKGTEIYKYDIDLGCARFRAMKVKRGRNLHLTVIDNVDSISVQKRNAEISTLKKQLSTHGECSCGGGGTSSAAAANTSREELPYGYATGDGVWIPSTRGWKNLDNEVKEEETGCIVM